MKKYTFINTFDQQNFILSYLHPENPYRSLIACYEVGLGKTYAAACLSHIYLSEGFKVLYVSSTLNSISNFSQEYNNLVNDSRLKNYYKNIKNITFNKFYLNSFEDEWGLVILDEVHNLREKAIRYKNIKTKLDSFLNSKILIMTGTPMIDSVDEFNSIKNLTNEEDPEISFYYNNSISKEVETKYIGNEINGQVLYLSEMKGKQLNLYKKVIKKGENKFHTLTRQVSICSNKFYDNKISLEEQSSKIYKLINLLKDGKLTVVFCFYIQKGIDFLASVLESIGYKKFDPNNSPCKSYSIIDGRNSIDETTNILNAFNSISNENGEFIHILIGSSVMSESITLFRVRELHILSPFWNYGQIKQSIGRTIRFNSHFGIKNKTLNIYLHAACDEYGKGNDLYIWEIAFNKKIQIEKKMKEEMSNSIKIGQENDILNIPKVDNNLVFEIGDVVWDFSNCFEKNKYKISWCRFDINKVEGYNKKLQSKIIGSYPVGIKVNLPIKNGYTIWRSCIDNKLRITKIDKETNKFSKRGKILSNVKTEELEQISIDLNCNIENIIDTLKQNNRYFDKQIEYDLQ